ncbi:hypothetical protein QFC19_004786 [Naganishia cerealis]|uniref:Uncharacterized protein n=1 Tax=Naganishia cerealis TaxID=610337 RepID=A0ACC2VTY3_9TREE|nr:hypothetical protein QFC19_004786 [Naganishia cerealis]
MTGDLVVQNAHDSSAIIAERKKREVMANRVIQTGGMITIKDALRMKRAREGDDMEKEARAEQKRHAKRDKLLAADNRRRKQQGLPEIPDHADPFLNPDYIHRDELQRTSYYAGWYQTQQQRPDEDEDLENFASDWRSESSNKTEEDELGRWGDGSNEDPFY